MLSRRLIAASLGAGIGIPAVVPFAANAVDFDGANDWLTRGADLSGNADGKKGIFSAWLRLDGGDGANLVIEEGGAQLSRPIIFRNTADVFQIQHKNTSGVVKLDLKSTTAYIASSTWRHLLASWDMAVAGSGRLYVTDVDDKNEITFVDDTLDYTQTDHAAGGRVNGTLPFNGCLADLYFNMAEYLDFDVVANRRKFIDASLKPVDLGSDGSTPTGTAPIVFFQGATVNWHTNKGGGGGFTENGALTDCDTSPSD